MYLYISITSTNTITGHFRRRRRQLATICDLFSGLIMPESLPFNAGKPLDSVPDPSFIVRVFESEQHHMPHPDYRLHLLRHRPVHLAARQDSINWILKVYVILHSIQNHRT